MEPFQLPTYPSLTSTYKAPPLNFGSSTSGGITSQDWKKAAAGGLGTLAGASTPFLNQLLAPYIGDEAAGYLFGTPSGYRQLDLYNPYQLQQMQNLLGQGMNQYANPTQGFEPIAQAAQSRFKNETLPDIMQRFNAMGSNMLSSPALGSQLASAGSQLQENLAAMQSQYGLNNQQNALQALQLGMTRPFDTVKEEGTQGAFQQILPILMQLGMMFI